LGRPIGFIAPLDHGPTSFFKTLQSQGTSSPLNNLGSSSPRASRRWRVRAAPRRNRSCAITWVRPCWSPTAMGSACGALRSAPTASSARSSWACPFRWPGQYEDAETGLYYNRFRYYDSESGQYASQDPIRLEGGLSPHAYPEDPVRSYDPLGLKSCTDVARSGRKGAFYEAVRTDTGDLLITSGPLSFKHAQARARGMMRTGDQTRGIYSRRRRDARDLAAKAGRGRPEHHAAHILRESGSKSGRFAHFHPAGEHGGHVWYGEAFR
jgi:RHS repeat-associated protein